MSKKVYDAVATMTYTDRNGQEKKNYVNVGSVFQGDKGMSLKMDSIPAGQWNGWISFYEPKEKQPQSKGTGRAGPLSDFADDVPF